MLEFYGWCQDKIGVECHPTSWTSTSEVDNGSAKVSFTPAVGDNDITRKLRQNLMLILFVQLKRLHTNLLLRIPLSEDAIWKAVSQTNDGSTFPLVVDITNGNLQNLYGRQVMRLRL